MKVGLGGYGRIAQLFHLPVLRAIPGVEVVAVAEPDALRRAEALAQCPGAKGVAEYGDLVGMEEVEAVVICLPSGLHAEAAGQAFAAGKAVYLEKPAGITVGEAVAVRDAWKRSGKVGMMGFNFRHHPVARDLRDAIAGERAGKIFGGRGTFCASASQQPGWKQKRASGGGVLLDLCSHHFDLWRYLLGSEIREVRAVTESVETEADTAWIEVVMENEVRAQGFYSLSSTEEHRWEFFGRGGKLSWDTIGGMEVEVETPGLAYNRRARIQRGLRGIAPRRLLRRPGEISFGFSLREFVRAVREGSQTGPDMEDGLRSVVAVAAAELSAEEGRSVELGEIRNP